MTLNDLKTGMIITTKEHGEYVIIRDFANDALHSNFIAVRPDDKNPGWIEMDDYNDDLTIRTGIFFMKGWDIVKVEKARHPFDFFDLKRDVDKRVLLWKREKCKRLTVSEIEYLLGYKVEIVSEEE